MKNSKKSFNRGYHTMFEEDKLSCGMFMPIEAFTKDIPTMQNQTAMAVRAEQLGFKGLWFRDIPLRDPNFGDVGQIFDPFVYMAYIASKTSTIALATGSVVLPLHHPIDIAKAATSVDVLSEGRVVLGTAAGDRPLEFPAYGIPYERRQQRYRDTSQYMKALFSTYFPLVRNDLGEMLNSDMLPKPYGADIAMMTTAYALQTEEWIAQNSDGWINFPRPLKTIEKTLKRWKKLTEPYGFKPYVQGLMLDLLEDEDAGPYPIHLGFSSGKKYLIEYLLHMKELGVNHVIFYLKLSKRPADEVLEQLGKEVLPFI